MRQVRKDIDNAILDQAVKLEKLEKAMQATMRNVAEESKDAVKEAKAALENKKKEKER